MIKVIIFDFDGIIVESVDIKTEAFAELFKKEGADAVKKIVGYHLDNASVSRYDKFRYIYRQILKRGLSDGEFKGLCDRFADLVMQSVVEAPYVKGAEEFLKGRAEKYKFFVVSATPQKEIEEIIKKRKMARFFTAIYGAPAAKKEAVKNILEKESIGPETAVYVGDAMSDYKAAGDNRVPFIARISQDNGIFSDIVCLKIKDLSYLEKAINQLDKMTKTL